MTRKEVKVILALARSGGIDTLDTAIAYGDSEACLGEVGTEGFNVVTKLPSLPENCPDVSRWIHEQIQSSLERLKVDSVYGLLLHRSQQLVGPRGRLIVKTLQNLKDDGLVNKIGVSIYSPNELNSVIQACPIDLVQSPFNLIDQRLHTSGWLQRLHDTGVEVHVRSVFLQGLLLMSQSAIPQKFAPWSHLWGIWHAWLEKHSVTATQACLAFFLLYPQIDLVIVGADNVDQLTESIRAAHQTEPLDLPDLHCDNERLINPSNWNSLETLDEKMHPARSA